MNASPPSVHHVFLVPGFFGFDNLGDLAYFVHVRDVLAAWCRARHLPVQIRVVDTLPTASLRQRAAHLVNVMHEEAGADEGPLYLVGHSSGGLDVRLVVTPQVSLPTEVDPEPLARRVRAVVGVAAPQHGTPVAAWFSSLLGQQLLKVFSLASAYALRTGRLPLDALAALTAFFTRSFLPARVARPGDQSPGLERLYQRLLADFSADRQPPLERFVGHIGRDQDLLPQIAPAAMDLFNASTEDRRGVRYGSVVTEVRATLLRSFAAAGLSPYAHATHALYLVVSRIAARMPEDRVPRISDEQRRALIRDLGAEPSRKDNDGIVPTLSQVWGHVIRAVHADHLDVIGHFHHPTHVPPHFDWLASGGGFSRAAFVSLWGDVARFMFDLG